MSNAMDGKEDIYQIIKDTVLLEKAARQTLNEVIEQRKQSNAQMYAILKKIANAATDDKRKLTESVDKLSERVEVCLGKTKVLPQDQAARQINMMIVFMGLSFLTSIMGGFATASYLYQNYQYLIFFALCDVGLVTLALAYVNDKRLFPWLLGIVPVFLAVLWWMS